MRFKLLLYSAILILTLNSVLSAQVGVFIEHKDNKQQSYCLNVKDNSNGFLTLSKIRGTKFKEIENQHILCSVDGEDTHVVCDSTSNRAWRIFLQDDGIWHGEDLASLDAGKDCYDASFQTMKNFMYYSFITHTFSNVHYCARQGDVIGIINTEAPTGRPAPPVFSLTPSFSEICDPFQFYDVDAFIDNTRAQNIDEESREITAIPPDSKLELEIVLRNNGLKEIKNIEIVGTIEGINNGKDLNEESANFNLNAGKDKTIKLEFDIPKSTNEDSYSLILKASGKDADGFNYDKEVKLDIEIEKKKHSIAIDEFQLNDTKICLGEEIGLIVKISNTGSSNEDISLKLQSEGLSMNFYEKKELSPVIGSNSLTRSYKFKHPQKLSPGIYPIMLHVESNNKRLEKTIDVDMQDCISNGQTKETESLKSNSGNNFFRQKSNANQSNISSNEITPYNDSPRDIFRTGLMSFAVVLSVACIVLFLGHYISKR